MKKTAIVLAIFLSIIVVRTGWVIIREGMDSRAHEQERVVGAKLAEAEERIRRAEDMVSQAQEISRKAAEPKWVTTEELVAQIDEGSRKAAEAQAAVEIEQKRRKDAEAERELKEKEENDKSAEFERQMGLVQSREQLAAQLKAVGLELLDYWVEDAKKENAEGEYPLVNVVMSSDITIPEVKKEFFRRFSEVGGAEVMRRIVKEYCDESPIHKEAVMNLKKLRRNLIDTKEISPELVKEIVREGTFTAGCMKNLIEKIGCWVPDMDRPETPEERKFSIGMVWRPLQEKYCEMVESGEIKRAVFMTFETEEFTATRKERAIKKAKAAKVAKD